MPGLKLGNQSLHVIPVIAGSKRGGIGKIIAGIALLGLSAVTGGAPLAGTAFLSGGSLNVGALAGTMGSGMLLTGVSSLLAPEMKSPDDTKSFTMTGPQNTTREGGIVPIIYGHVWTGGTMISGALNIVTKEV
ncbi:tail assembly protein [Paracoccus cavernae]